MSWRTRIRLLRSRVKWPGWAMIVWSIFWWTPELYGKVDFWLNTAREIGGRLGQIAAVITSPWFNLVLMLAGILWLCFVGESRYTIRHPAMPYVGWGLVGLLAFAFWSVLVAGYVASRVSHNLIQTNQELQQEFDALKQQTARRILTDGQKEKLMEVLNKVPPGTTYKLTFHTILNCDDCSIYITDLKEVWGKVDGWEVGGGGPHFGLDPRLIGIFVLIGTENCPDKEIRLIISALNAAEIKYQGARAEEKFGPGCFLLVGSRARQ